MTGGCNNHNNIVLVKGTVLITETVLTKGTALINIKILE